MIHSVVLKGTEYFSDTILADSPQGTKGPASHSLWGLSFKKEKAATYLSGLS